MLNEFIDKVIVYERRKINRYQYDQQIEIYFNFIGKVTLPEEETEAAPGAPKTLHVASNSSFAPIGDYLSAQRSTRWIPSLARPLLTSRRRWRS